MRKAYEFFRGPFDGDLHKVPADWRFVVRPLRATFAQCTGLPGTMSLEGAKTYVKSSTCGLYELQVDRPNGRGRMVWHEGA